MKDIVVDNNVAKNFANPLDDEYKKFVSWLTAKGYLAVCNQLLHQYVATCGTSSSSTNICVIIGRLTREGRLLKKSNKELKAFRFPKRRENQLRCNQKDRDILKTVLLSLRKYALTTDKKLRHDINKYPGFNALAVSRPEHIAYAD